MIDPITFIRVIFLLAFSVSVPSVFAISIYAQDVTITGRVTDESGLPVAGAMIDAFALPERDLGVGETDENGHFRVEGSGLSSENCESSDPQKSCWLAAYCGPVKGRFFGKSTTLFHISPNSPRPLTMNIDMVCHWVSGSSLQTEPDPYPDDSNRRNATERTSLPHADPTAQTRTSQKATDPTFTEQAGGSPAAIRTHPDSSASTSNAHKEGISASRADNPLIQQEDHPVIANMVVRTGHAGLIQQMAFSADGDLLGTWSADGALIIWRTDNLHERTRFQPRTEMGVPVFAFSSGGLLVAEGSEVACYSLETNSKRSVLASLPSRVMDFQTSPNGAWLAYTDDDRAVRLVSLSSAKRSQVLVLKPPTENEDFGIQLAFNQSSSRLAVAEPNGKIEVYALSADSVWQVHQETLEFTPRTLGFDPSDTLWLFGVAPSQDDDVRAVLYAEIPTLVKYTTPAHTSAISVPFNVTGMRFGGSSKTLLLMGRHDVDNAWKDNTGGLPEGIKVVSPPTPWMSPGLVTAAEAAFSLADGGEYVATGDYQDQLAIWEIATRT
jgi:WD40 repeat protein